MADELIRMQQTEMDFPLYPPEDDAETVNVFRPNDLTDDKKDIIRRHQIWLGTIRKEFPRLSAPYRIGVYIRYFNQTKYEDYLDYHKKEFESTISLCPLWTLVDFYVDNGPSAPNMESAPEWCRLMTECSQGKVNLIITQKVSNVSRKTWDLTFAIRLLASWGVGIYFISEDIFTAASYYLQDMQDRDFLPEGFPFFPDSPTGDSPELSPDISAGRLNGGSHVE